MYWWCLTGAFLASTVLAVTVVRIALGHADSFEVEVMGKPPLVPLNGAARRLHESYWYNTQLAGYEAVRLAVTGAQDRCTTHPMHSLHGLFGPTV